MYGCCFHFALRLHERFGYSVRGVQSRSDANKLGHVWSLTAEDKGIDIRGIYSEELLLRMDKRDAAEVRDVTPGEVQQIIEGRGYPRDLERRILELADWIIDNHERFQASKPKDQSNCAKFVEDLGSAPSQAST